MHEPILPPRQPSLPPPEGGQQPQFVVVQPPPEPWLPKVAKRVAGGLACASVVAVLMNFGGVKWVVIHVFALLLSLFGRDVYSVKPADAAREAAKDVIKEVKRELPAPAIPGTTLPGLGHKTPEQTRLEDERKEKKRLADLESEIRTWQARADAIKFPCGKDWPVEKYRVEVPAAEKRDRDDKARAREEELKKPYLQRADKINFEVDPAWDIKTTRQQVEDAELELKLDGDYQAALRQWERDVERHKEFLAKGPNARCPNPKCRHAFRTNRTKGTFICSGCQEIYPVVQARAKWIPPASPRKPEPPKKNPGVWGRIKRAFK